MLKTDRRGRVRFTAVRRDRLIDEFQKSGMSAPRFCKVTGLSYSTFATWLQKHRRQRAALPERAPSAAAVEWLETVVEKAPAAPASAHPDALVVRLPSGATLEVATASQASVAASLLRAWEKAPC
jgi:transposase